MKNIRHVGIVVKDIARSLRFYRDVLGFDLKKDKRERGSYIDKVLGIKNADVRTVKLSDGKATMIELLYYYNRPKDKGRAKKIYEMGYSHVAISVDDVGREYRRLRAKGIRFNSPPQESPDGYAKIAFCKDPDGAFIELVEVLDKKPKVKR